MRLCVYIYLSVCLFVGQKIGFETTTCNHQTFASVNLLQYMLLLGITASNSVTGKEDDGHKIKQAVNCLGPELLLNNAPAPNFVHFSLLNVIPLQSQEMFSIL